MTNFNNLSQLHSTDLIQSQMTSSQQLEKFWSPSTSQKQRSSMQQSSGFIKRVGRWLVAFLTDDRSVRIWTSYGKDGVVWHVYDPISDRRSSHTTEEGLRAWLESRHLS